MKIGLKTYHAIRIGVTMALAATISATFTQNNYIIPILAVMVAMVVLFFAKKHVDGVLLDERDMELGGKSAMLAIQMFSMLACVGVFVFYAYRDINPVYEAISTALSVSVCILMLIYSFVFRFIGRSENTDKRMIFTFIVLAIFLIAGIRLLSGEDTWNCGKNGWEKHGNPSFSAPITLCENGKIIR